MFEPWIQLLCGDQNRSPLFSWSRNRSAISSRSCWIDIWFHWSKAAAGRPELVLYDFLQTRVLSMKLLVSLRDACWKPKCSQSSFTDGTLLNDIDGFDDIVRVVEISISLNVKIAAKCPFTSVETWRGTHSAMSVSVVCCEWWSKIWTTVSPLGALRLSILPYFYTALFLFLRLAQLKTLTPPVRNCEVSFPVPMKEQTVFNVGFVREKSRFRTIFTRIYHVRSVGKGWERTLLPASLTNQSTCFCLLSSCYRFSSLPEL